MDTITTIVDNATSSAGATTGIPVDGLLAYVGENFIKPVFGSGLGLFYDLRFWIITLVLASVVVFFVYRWFKFSHH